MSHPSLQAQGKRVQTLLSRLQNNLDRVPNELQGEIGAEITRLASYLERHVPAPAQEDVPAAPAAFMEESGSTKVTGSELWLERALNEARMGAWQWDLVSGTIRWSSSMYALYGVDPEAGPIGHEEFIAMIHPEDQQIVRDEFTRAAEQNGLFSHDFRFTCPDGKLLWIRSSGAVEVDESGRVVRIGGINRDISDRKRAEEAVRESREREARRAAELQALMDAVPAMIWISRDPLCREIEGNRYGYEYLQMPKGSNLSKSADDPEALALQPYQNYRDGRELTESELPMQIAAATGKPVWEHEVNLVFRDGSSKYALGNALPLTDVEGNAAGAVAAFIDITERKRSEGALREAERRVSQLVDTSYEGIWSVDENGVTTFLNHRAAEILGYEIEEIQGRNAFEFLMADDVEAGRQTLARIAQGESGRVEARAKNKSGEEAWLLVSFAPLISNQGVFQGALAMFSDITERKHAEQLLARREADLREAQRIAHLGDWYWDAATDATTGSEELYRIFGLNPETDRMLDFREQRGTFYSAETWDQLNEAARATAQTGIGYELDVRAFRGTTPIWVTLRGEAVEDPGGQFLGLRGTVQDITERKQAEILSRAKNEINQIIHSSLDTSQTLDRTLSAAAEALECETAALSLRKGQNWYVRFVHGLADEVIGTEMDDAQEPHAVLAIQTKKPVAISDAFNDPRVNCEHMRAWGVRSVLVIPVLRRDEPMAVMFFNYQSKAFDFRPAHLDFAEKFAASLSLALENSRLYEDLKEEIKERRETEAKLQESHARLQMAMDAARLGMWEVDVTTLDATLSPRMAEIGGFSPEQTHVRADEWQSIILDDLPSREGVRTAAGQQAAPYELEFRYLPKGESRDRWLHVWATFQGGSSGEAGRFLGMAMDISERKQTEQEACQRAEVDAFRVALSDALRAATEPAGILAAALQMLENQLAASGVCHAVILPEGQEEIIEAASGGAGALTGLRFRLPDYGRDLARDHPNGQIRVRGDIPHDPQLTEAQKAACEHIHMAASIEAPLRRHNRVTAVLSVRQSTPRRWTEAEAALVLETAERTWARLEQVRAEASLRESEERFHTSIETLPQTFVIFSAVREPGQDGAPRRIVDLRYEYVNEATCRMNHLPRERLIGHTLLGLPPDHPARSLFDRYVRVIETGEPLAENISVLDDAFGKAEEKRRTWYVRAARFGERIVVIRDDVTKQARLEADRRHAITRMEIQQRLAEQSETERQNYAREIHDGPIQTLASIGFNLAFIKDVYPDPALRVELDQIGLSVKSATQELRQVINELRPPAPLRFGLSKAIEYHADSLRERSPQIRWEYRLAEDRDLLPEPKRLALFRIYQEAVNNIMRHSGASRAWVHFRTRRKAAVLEIGDNGKGMPSKIDLASLMEHNHFGLAGMKERVEAIGGTVDIITAPEAGTRIKVSLPLAE